MKTVRVLAAVLFFSVSTLFAECELDRGLLDAYLLNERSLARDVGYPYLVSFNKKDDAKLVREAISANWIDGRSIDCESVDSCVKLTESLVSIDIVNIDLGAYQINRRYFIYPTHEYFTIKKAEKRVCEIVKEHSDRHGWSWKTLARYHSSTPKRNHWYKMRLAENYRKVTNQ